MLRNELGTSQNVRSGLDKRDTSVHRSNDTNSRQSQSLLLASISDLGGLPLAHRHGILVVVLLIVLDVIFIVLGKPTIVIVVHPSVPLFAIDLVLLVVIRTIDLAILSLLIISFLPLSLTVDVVIEKGRVPTERIATGDDGTAGLAPSAVIGRTIILVEGKELVLVGDLEDPLLIVGLLIEGIVRHHSGKYRDGNFLGLALSRFSGMFGQLLEGSRAT
mmetsp:Transcript_25194/g.72879  ORF Transcript_25194/g.72879 Transcript_25194/m.72879 type:complete len:218 (-) Transcript_25194:2357-3010(-)